MGRSASIVLRISDYYAPISPRLLTMTSHRARLVATAVVALAIVGGTSAPASAHAAYKNSDPADETSVSSAPSQIWAEFTEPPGPGSFMEVFDECGEQVDAGDSRNDGYRIYLSMSGTRSGTYRVTFNVASATDSHVTRGEFTFMAASGEPCPAEEPVEPNEPRQRERERDREQPPGTSNDTVMPTMDPRLIPISPTRVPVPVPEPVVGAGAIATRAHGTVAGQEPTSVSRDGSRRDEGTDEPQAAAADVNEPEEPGIFTGIPLGGSLAALLDGRRDRRRRGSDLRRHHGIPDLTRPCSSRTKAARVWTVLGLAALAVLVSALPVRAHALLDMTVPTSDSVVEGSPEAVTATYNETVEIAFGALRVYNTEGERVDTGESDHPGGDLRSVAVGLRPDLPDGTYTVTYRVISADGHPIEGAFVFHVGKPGEQPQGIGETLLSGDGGSGALEQILYGVSRWALFAGIALLVGAFSFLMVVWSRVRDAIGWDEAHHRFIARWRSIAVTGWWVTLAATATGFVLQGAVAADVSVVKALSPSVGRELLETRYGIVALLRLGLILVLAGIWLAGTRTSSAWSILPVRRGSTVGAAAASTSVPFWASVLSGSLLSAMVATPGLSGHAGATEPVWLNLPIDAIHVAAASIWMGGLVCLIACAFRAAPTDASSRPATLGPVVIEVLHGRADIGSRTGGDGQLPDLARGRGSASVRRSPLRMGPAREARDLRAAPRHGSDQ